MKKQVIAAVVAAFIATFTTVSLMGCHDSKQLSENSTKKESETKENKDPFVEIDYFWSPELDCYVRVVYETHSGVVYYVSQNKFYSGMAEAHSSKNPNEPMLKDEYIELYGSSEK